MNQPRLFKKYHVLGILFFGLFFYAYIFHSSSAEDPRVENMTSSKKNAVVMAKDTKVKMSKINLKHVVVHVDLKKTPLRLSYLARQLVLLRRLGVTGLLMEYEDMFPYEGELLQLRNPNYYSKDKLMLFLETCKLLNLEVIPLVQTFGHLQFVLQLPQFLHLREQKKYLDSICPSNPESLRLIWNMLSQMITFHTSVAPLKHFHIGCDEVNISMCKKCKERHLSRSTIFIEHVRTVTSMVKSISETTKVLIWDDMLVKLSPPEPIPVEPVKWYYRNEVSKYLRKSIQYLKKFPNIWIASAFKGADGPFNVLPNVKNRFINTFMWLNVTHDYKFKGDTQVINFTGIILTGWSRYDYTSAIVDTLPSSIPSLILNLLVVSTFRSGYLPEYATEPNKFYTKYIHRKLLMILDCNLVDLQFKKSKIGNNRDNLFLGNCNFTEWKLYKSLKEYLYLHYNLKHNKKVTSDYETCHNVSSKIFESNSTLFTALNDYYATDFVTEYVSDLMTRNHNPCTCDISE